MIESLHRRMEREPLTPENRWRVVGESAQEVGPALFYSLAIITVSFLPVFVLEAQEGRLFKPLAFTKTYAMAAAAILSITLVPVLMGYFIRGRIVPERKNPLNTALIRAYRPFLDAAVAWPWATVVLAVLVVASLWWPLQRIGSEFMPALDEGDLPCMPSLFPGVSIGKAREILQQTDRLIATVLGVQSVHGNWPCSWWPACGGRCSASARSSCRRWTRATCSTCRACFPACRSARRGRSCSRPTA